MTTDIFRVRRESLQEYVRDKHSGNKAAFSRAAHVQSNQVNLLLTNNPSNRRNLGEALARKMEKNLGLNPGYFDVSHGSDASTDFQIGTWDVPASMLHIFGRESILANVAYYDSYLTQLSGKITARENLRLCQMATNDMRPEIEMGEHLVVDIGVKAVTADGIYVLDTGDDRFLRRVTKRLSGHWLIEATNPIHEPVTVKSLSGFSACCRLVLSYKQVRL